MLFTNTAFIGVDPTALRKPFTYAALDRERRLIALGRGEMNALLAFVGGQQEAFVAVNAPSHPNKGLMEREDVRQRLLPPPRPGRWLDLRLAEYQLRRLRIGVTPTPARADLCPQWMLRGFAFYRSLEKMGCQAYPARDAPHQWLEVHPHASFCVLLGGRPFPKRTLEGRLQRQLALHEQGVVINDAMIFLEEITRFHLLRGNLPLEKVYAPDALDAIVAAYTAFLAAQHPGKVTLLGAVEEGQIVLPVAELKARY